MDSQRDLLNDPTERHEHPTETSCRRPVAPCHRDPFPRTGSGPDARTCAPGGPGIGQRRHRRRAVLRRKPPPHALPLGRGAAHALRHLHRQRGHRTVAFRRIHLPGVSGHEPSRRPALHLRDGPPARHGLRGRQGAVAGADRLLVRRGERRERPGGRRRPGRRTHREGPDATEGHHGAARPGHPPPLHRHDLHDPLLG